MSVAKKLKIAFVWPSGFSKHELIPLAFGYLAANIDRNSVDLKLFDCALDEMDCNNPNFRRSFEEFRPDMVCVSSYSFNFLEALNVLRMAKSMDNNPITVIGGCHATSYAEKVMKHPEIDYIFKGEAELSFPKFVNEMTKSHPDFSNINGLVYRTESGTLVLNEMDRIGEEKGEDMDEIKTPDYDFIKLDDYIKADYRNKTLVKENAPVWVTRGCPYRCGFCSAPELNGRPIRTHSVDYMIKWVEHLYHDKGIRWINIIDDNFTYHAKYAEEFYRRIIDLGLKDLQFGTPNGIRMGRGGPVLWDLMRRAGWDHLVVAPETGSQDVANLMDKDIDLSKVPQIVEDIKEAGLKVQAFFIIGYPGETLADIKLTEKMIKENRFNWIGLHTFQPLPGTPVYDELVEKGEIKDGLLPYDYIDGSIAYLTPGLVGFNFSRFVLKNYLLLALRDPLNIPYALSLFSPSMAIKRLFLNIINGFWHRPHRSKMSGLPQMTAMHIEKA
jgi:anaerobic magnesium-protoporphyrin IX monomethyl ester cyclase